MITVKYFANLKSIAGKEEEQFDLGAETTVLELSREIGRTSPALGEMMREKKIMISVNQDVVSPDGIVRDGDEVALLPPFSGGVDSKRTSP